MSLDGVVELRWSGPASTSTKPSAKLDTEQHWDPRRTAYRKIGVNSRTQAILWGIDHGFKPDNRRIDHWRNGP